MRHNANLTETDILKVYSLKENGIYSLTEFLIIHKSDSFYKRILFYKYVNNAKYYLYYNEI